MQFPESWLREFCNPDLTTQQLADTLTMAGLEVEELQPVAPPFTKIVVGEIKEAVQHPNADRLRVCQVDVGQGSLLNIVCGAPNARVGIRVPCALVGAELPPGEDGKPFQIKLGKLRGVESQGMLCSARELQLSEDHGGLLELPADAPVGANVRDVLGLDDTLFTLKPGDCLLPGMLVDIITPVTGAGATYKFQVGISGGTANQFVGAASNGDDLKSTTAKAYVGTITSSPDQTAFYTNTSGSDQTVVGVITAASGNVSAITAGRFTVSFRVSTRAERQRSQL